MKKQQLITIVGVAMLLLTLLCGCGVSDNSSSNKNEGLDTTTTESISLSSSEKERIAENQAIRAFVREWDREMGWDTDGLRYSIGTIKEYPSGSYYKVSGKWYWYDQYGDLKKTGEFDVEVSVHDDGTSMVEKTSVHYDY